MPSSRDLPDPGIEPVSPVLQAFFFFFFLPLSHRGSPEDSLLPPKFHFLYYVPELLILKALIPSITTRATCMRVLSCPGSELAISRADSASS